MKKVILDDYNMNIPGEQGIIGAVTTTWGHMALRNGWKIIDITNNDMAKVYRIRKLTPRECFRLMGVDDLDISKIQNYPLVYDGEDFSAPEGLDASDIRKRMISESQQYKMAGNSIVVDCLAGIFTQMFKSDQETLF